MSDKNDAASGDREEQPKVVIRDRRRIDPETGAARSGGGRAQSPPAGRSGVATSGAAAPWSIHTRVSGCTSSSVE